MKNQPTGILHPLVTHRETVPLPHDPVRADMVAGLESLTGFVVQHDIPLGRYEFVNLQHTVRAGNAAEGIAEVQRLAALMDVEPEWNDDKYVATRMFGPNVEYRVVYRDPMGAGSLRGRHG